MHDLNLRGLRKRLLRGGVAPKHVKRTLKELRYHFADLEQKALAEGSSRKEAATQAAKGIGDPELIIEEALARPELKSWAYRWPCGVYGVLPGILLALTVVGSILVVSTFLALAESASGLSPTAFANALFDRLWARSLLEIWTAVMVYVVPSVFAGGLCVFAAKRDAPILWPALGVFLIVFLGFAYNLSVTPPPAPDQPGQIVAGIGLSRDWLLSVRVLRLLVPLVLVLGPYYWWHQRQEAALSA